jgi:transaldolase
MELYLDTANIQQIRDAARLGIISGVTTNPSLMAKEKGADFRATVQEICSIIQGPISAEVTCLEPDAMIEEAMHIATWSPYVVIKVPITESGLEVIHSLSQMAVDAEHICDGCAGRDRCATGPESAREIVEGVPIATNATLCFSMNQGLMAAAAGATYVSPFVGRLDDVGHDGMQLVADLAELYFSYEISTRIIAASIRHPLHITQAAQAGADIATVPYEVLMKAIKHPLTDSGVERFLADWQKFRGV